MTAFFQDERNLTLGAQLGPNLVWGIGAILGVSALVSIGGRFGLSTEATFNELW